MCKTKKKFFYCYNAVYFIAQTLCSINSNFSVIKQLKSTGHVMHQHVLTSRNFTFCHTEFVCFVFIWEQTATCATYSINWLVFITEIKSVYCTVRTGSLN